MKTKDEMNDGVTVRIGQRLALYGVLALVMTSGLGPVRAAAPAPWDRSAPALASNGQVTLAVWQEKRASDYDLVGARLDASGRVLDSFVIAGGPGDQAQPAVASDGTDFLVVWTDTRNPAGADIYGARVSAAGVVLDPHSLPICTAPLNQHQPAVASDGANYLVVWQDFRGQASADIFGARVSPAGEVLDPAGIAISQGAASELNPAVAGAADGFLVVWQDARSAANFDIYGTRVTSLGTVSQPSGIPISTAGGDQINPAVSGNGGDFLVVWQDFRSDAHFNLYGTVVTRSGDVRSPSGAAIGAAARDPFNPAVASCGGDFFTVWTEARGVNNSIYGSRITAAGAALDPNGISMGGSTGERYHPAVAGFGTGYWVAWHEYRPGTGAGIYGCHLNVTGAVLDGASILLSAVSSTPPQAQTPVIAWAKPADIVYGTALGGGQLNASANVAGTFQYAPPAGTVLKAGNGQTLTVTFMPADTQAYTTVSATVLINVQRAPLTVTAESKTKQAGQPNPVLTAAYTGFVNGDTVASLTSPATLTTTATAGSPAGTYPIVANGAVGANYAISYLQGTLTVVYSVVITRLTVQPSDAPIFPGQTRQFTATAVYSDGRTAPVTASAQWQSSLASVATVDGTGLVKGMAPGKAQITASLANVSASAVVTVQGPASRVTKTFSNIHEIEFHGEEGASIYPSTIDVAGMSGRIDKVTVTLNQLNLSSPRTAALLLVGPAGQKVVLMAGAGGRQAVEKLNLTLDDLAPASLPKDNRLVSGVYKPANYAPPTGFRSSAPAGPYLAALAAFQSTEPNGKWRLFIQISGEDQEGSLHGGWSLAVSTLSAP